MSTDYSPIFFSLSKYIYKFKGIYYVGQFSDTNGVMILWSEFKREFSLSKNINFYWIQLNSEIQKAWDKNLYQGDKKFHDHTFNGHHVIKKYHIYSLSNCNSK